MTDRLDQIGPQRVVSVFGSGEVAAGDPQWQTAHEVGRQLAQLGYAVANGGYGGTMEASAKGAAEGGGAAIGITCTLWKSEANEHISRAIVTDDLPERIQTLIEIGRAGYVVLPGATGTLAELAWVWEMSFKGFLARRPIVCVGEFWRPLVEMMARIRPAGAEFVDVVSSVGELSDHFPPG